MPSDMPRPVAPVATAMLVAGLMTSTAVVLPAAAAHLQEKASVSTGGTVTPEAETVLTSAAVEALCHIAQARGNIAGGRLTAAGHELDETIVLLNIAETSLPTTVAYTEVHLPLNATRELTVRAKQELRRNNAIAAANALKAAEDNAVYLSVAVHEPLAEAHQSLWHAARAYAADAYSHAKADVRRAVDYLDYAMNGADGETRKVAAAVISGARSLETQIETTSASVPSQLEQLWRLTKALSERSVEYFTTGWQSLGAKPDFKASLIEAKLHLSYAEIDRFVAMDVDETNKELGQAREYLDRALEQAAAGEAPRILAIRAGVDELEAEHSADQGERRYAELRSRLGELIEAR